MTRSRRFRVISATVVVILAVTSVILGVLALERGPRVRSVTGDTALAVVQPDVVVTLRTDQPLQSSSVEGVVVEPATPVELEVEGAQLRVRFARTLDFATSYRVEVPALRGAATGAVGSGEYRFTTPALTVTTLERGGAFDRTGGDDDRVVRRDLSHGTQATLLSAPRIQEYADSGDGVIALTLDPDGVASLVQASADGAASPLTPPGSGAISLLRASADAGRVGFVYTGSSSDGASGYTSTLFMIDPAEPDAPAQPVRGTDGAPLRVDAWQFVPGTGYLVAQTSDQSLVLADATGAAAPRLLGQLGDLRAVLPGSTSIVVGTVAGLSVLDLTNGSVTDLPGTGSSSSTAGSVVLSSESVVSWTAAEVVRSRPGGPSTPVLDAVAGERVDEVCVSPSGRHLAVGIVPDSAVVDGYPVRAEWRGRRTDIVEVDTGVVVARIDGTRPDWCA